MVEHSTLTAAKPRYGEPIPPPRLYPPRYDMLDAWRGLAALAVVLYHIIYAILLFFVISGYCISAAAEACRARGLSFRTFMWRRIRRIFPPYWLALAFFVVTRAIKLGWNGNNELAHPLLIWIQNITLTQWLTLMAHPMPSASNNPANFLAIAWTLDYEEQFYLLVALLLALFAFFQRRTARSLSPLFPALVVLTIAGLIWNAIFPRTSFGIFLDYWADFGVGCLVFYRLCRIDSRILRRTIDAFLIGLIVWGGIVRYKTNADTLLYARLAPLELAIAAGWGMALILLRPLNQRFSPSLVGRWLMRLGVISYSLYLIHQFNRHAIAVLTARLLPRAAPHALFVALELIMQIILASIFWYFCERPFLNRSLPGESRKSCVVQEMMAESRPAM